MVTFGLPRTYKRFRSSDAGTGQQEECFVICSRERSRECHRDGSSVATHVPSQTSTGGINQPKTNDLLRQFKFGKPLETLCLPRIVIVQIGLEMYLVVGHPVDG